MPVQCRPLLERSHSSEFETGSQSLHTYIAIPVVVRLPARCVVLPCGQLDGCREKLLVVH